MDCSTFREDMLDILYGEADTDTQKRFEQHNLACEACRAELVAFKGVRRSLAEWKLPDERPFWPRLAFWPRGLAAAAVLILAFGGGLGLSGAEFRYDRGPLSLRLGRSRADVSELLARQEARHEQEMQQIRAQIPQAPSADETPILHKVEALIHQSESRQAMLLHTSLADFNEKAEAQRRYDLARVSAGLSYLDGRTGEQVARATELMGYVLQASEKR